MRGTMRANRGRASETTVVRGVVPAPIDAPVDASDPQESRTESIFPESEDKAGKALFAMSTLSRMVPYDKIKELVEEVMKGPTVRLHLPVLILHLRNHSKSLAPGVGMGERSIPLSLLCALYECDAPMAAALLKDMVLYGGWNSISSLLVLTDKLDGDSGDKDGDPARVPKFSEFQAAMHRLFANQLRADEAAAANGRCVSNASKYVPHEGRKALPKRHSDAIAALLFPETAGGGNASALRRRFRQLRARLNRANGHIAEMYLSAWRAGELRPSQICAGVYAKNRHALLNITRKGGERHAEPGRRSLRLRIKRALQRRRGHIPAPADLQELG